MEKLADELVPAMHSETLLMQAATRVAREGMGDGSSISPGARPETFWVMGPRQQKGKIPRLLVIVDVDAASDFRGASPRQREAMVEKLRRNLTRAWKHEVEQVSVESFEPKFIVTADALL